MPKTTFRRNTRSPYEVPRPAYRRLRIYSIDPSLGHSLETSSVGEVRVEIPWETLPDNCKLDGPAPGPKGQYLNVIDYDPASKTFYKPIDLNDPYLLAQDGLAPSDGNPQFHQQMVYAVAMRTIRNFEIALGRRALWAPRWLPKKGEEYVPQLRIYPHALREANAYYSPEKKALLFGYFQSAPSDRAKHLRGGIVFTCLSHDIIAHETTHALLDGMHRRFTEPSNPDVLAFHEAFADLVALFQHFSLPEVVRHEIARTRGELNTDNLLANLAKEFGSAIGRTGALRSAIGRAPDPEEIETVTEPHERGSILVAAVFEAFLAIYRRRTEDLFRLATDGTGILPEGAIHPDLVSRLASEASRTASHVLTICIRALDYMPPVDVTFGDYLRALITSDYDLFRDDVYGYRVAFMEAFRRRGILPNEIRTLSEESLRWESPDLTVGNQEHEIFFSEKIKDQMRKWNLSCDRHESYTQMKKACEATHGVIKRNKKYNQEIIRGLDLEQYPFEVHSIRPLRRTGQDGEFLMDVLVVVTQRVPGYLDRTLEQCQGRSKTTETPDFWFRGGCTMLFDLETGRLRYCVYKNIKNAQRYERQRKYLNGMSSGPSLAATYFRQIGYKEQEEVFCFVHRTAEAGGSQCQS